MYIKIKDFIYMDSTLPITCKAAVTLGQILQVRNLRNTSCQFMTNHQKHISIVKQIIWYFRYYRLANQSGDYRIHLFHDHHDKLIGYGALHLNNTRSYVTECVKPVFRGQGYGKAILTELVNIAQKNGFDPAAEIWADNKLSTAMHEKMGFKLMQTSIHNNRILNSYLLKAI